MKNIILCYRVVDNLSCSIPLRNTTNGIKKYHAEGTKPTQLFYILR